MKLYFKQILVLRNRALLGELVRTDFKLRYQGSMLGYLWSLLRPLFLFGILYVVFGKILRFGNDIPNYPVYLLLGIVLWSFFSEATKQGAASIVSRGALLRKINFPRFIIVISATLSAFINFMLSLLVVFVFMMISGVQVSLSAVYIIPLLIVELYVLVLAVAFILATINVRYRDIQHIWDIVIQAGFYATPIIYPVGLVLEQSQHLATMMLMSNPLAQIIQDAREVLVTDKGHTLAELGAAYFYLVPVLVIACMSVLAVAYFRKRSKYFAEDM